MEVDAMLADSVVSAEGKLYVQGGGWNVLSAATIPARHPRIGLAVVVHVPWTATNQSHSFEVRIVDADANEIPLGDAPPGFESPDGKIRRLGGEFNIGRPPQLPVGDEQVIPFAVNIDGMVFEQQGQYRIVISIDGTDLKELPIRVQQVAMAGPLVS